ncbi:glycoside hydrolase family 43 protein [Pedobacter rhodius]|uniref:Glycoside hydrolase 43 family protein n=1 Tax=Pedobacter rhodius TaxID=3004098 RepID=A0ABT4KX25_9SPHI|nr:glycoside hydrolase 43 family protein [Pedobacter sp. SJ11]MCZ4223476.1 glycoside hydrolase 43 family protein [Pedobacter sp. SJ11]
MKYLIKVSTIFIFLISRSVLGIAQQPVVSKVWVADQGDGTYKNPILNADYSDPDVIRVGNDYYMTASSFNCVPGLPILHSKDLVNWTLVNHALKKQLPEDIYNTPQHGKGVWAPSMIFHKGEYRIYYPDPDFGIYMVKTKDPLGDWEKPIMVLPGKGIIDPSSFWDEDGEAYLAVGWAASRAGVNSLLTVYKMNDEGTEVMDEGTHVFDGHEGNHTVEGPKFYKRNGFYYLFAPAGGVATGWQLILRSKNIYGPYAQKIVMDQGKTTINGPHQGALVQTQKGEDWFLHFQDKGVYGRVVHLQPVKWKDNWPVIGTDLDGDGKGEPIYTHKKPDVGKIYPIATPAESDEFDADKIELQWQWHANPKIQWSALIKGTGYLRLFAYPFLKEESNLWNSPNLLLQKFPSSDFSATTKIKFSTEWDVWQGKKAGLLIMGNDYAYLSIAKDDKGYKLNQVVCKDALNAANEKITAEVRIKVPTAFLKVKVSGPNAICNFSYSEDGINFKPIGTPFQAQPDKWIGAKIGLFCTSSNQVKTGGYADVDWFRIDK